MAGPSKIREKEEVLTNVRGRWSQSLAQGAAMGTPYAAAYRGLMQRADARSGETVLIHGASGGVGIAAVQLARAHGLRVLGTAGTDRGRGLARAQSAHEASTMARRIIWSGS